MGHLELDRLRNLVVGSIEAVGGRVQPEPASGTAWAEMATDNRAAGAGNLVDLLFANEHSLTNIQFVNLGRQVLWAIQMETCRMPTDCPPRKQLKQLSDRINTRLRHRGLA